MARVPRKDPAAAKQAAEAKPGGPQAVANALAKAAPPTAAASASLARELNDAAAAEAANNAGPAYDDIPESLGGTVAETDDSISTGQAEQITNARLAEASEPEDRDDHKPAAKGHPGAGVKLGFGAALDEDGETVNILYYGTEGTGKTTDLMRMANLGRVLVVNAEAGIKARRLRQLEVQTDNIVVWPRPGEELTYKGLEDLYWNLRADLQKDPQSWVGAVWDSVTEIHKRLLDQVVERQWKAAVQAGKERDEHFIDRADYGTMTEQMRRLLRRYRDLPIHFGMSALERVDDDGTLGPAVNPALIPDLAGFVDILVHTQVDIGFEDGERIELYGGQTRKEPKVRAKDRWKATPRLMADPWFDRVVAYVHEDLSAETDENQASARAALAAWASQEDARKAAGGRKPR